MENHEQIKGRPGLKALRKAAGLTQAQLAHAVGVSEKAARDWENDDAIPSFGRAVLIAKSLGISLRRLAQEFGLDVQDIPTDLNQTPDRADNTIGGGIQEGGDVNF